MAEQASKVSGVVQIDGAPAQRTVRAYSYEAVAQTVNGTDLTLSKSLGHANSDPSTGEYTIDLLDGYDQRIFVVAFDDYGADFKPDLAVAVGDRVHPTTPTGHVWECTGSGTLPSEEPAWVIDTETAQLYGTAAMIARPFYRPMVHGPVTPQIVAVAVDDYFSSVVALLHFDEDWSDITGKTWTPINSPTFSGDVKKFGSASGAFINGPYLEGPASDAWAFGNQDFTVECWAYAIEMPAVYYQAPMGNWYSSTGGCFFLRPNGVMSWHSGSQQVASGAGVIQVAKWHHLAYSRKDGVGRLFVDGVKVGPDLSDTTNFTWTQAWRIGGNRVASDWWRGFVDEVRITKGVARYTESFTPPSKPFPNQGPA
ncbi:LamG domain-containing protein [Marinobacter alkaliphilus]|uniref:LamG domain-containing protein n=1 Tax=Marinobacter alkaliphilus TaxID=254719 RepID=A0ABZ3E619_9GAMM